MKLKKFFAGVLAAAMMLTVGATAAFATTPAGGTDEAATSVKTTIKFDEKLTKDSEIPLYKTYNVVNGVSPAEAFHFTVKYVKILKHDTKNWAPSYAKDKVVIEDIATDEFPSMTTGQTASKFLKLRPLSWDFLTLKALVSICMRLPRKQVVRQLLIIRKLLFTWL